MSRLAALLVLMLAGSSLPALACINTFETEIKQYLLNNDELGLKAIMYDLESKYQEDPSLEHTNDLAVARLLTRRYPEAIQLLKEADTQFNGSAIVAANLGTALELSGNDVEALHWIREGVRRDPNEHRGSEWLHVKILEAKVALAADPEWLMKNTVLGVSFGEGDLPVMPASLPTDEKGRRRTAAEIMDAIDHQLMERTQFVKPPDAIVADLYATQGDLVFAAGPPPSYDASMGIPTMSYGRALEYEPPRRDLVERRGRHFVDLYPDLGSWDAVAEREKAARLARPEPPSPMNVGWYWVVPALVVVAGAIYSWRRRRLTKP